MRIGSLFAGLGGLEKGLEDAGLGETVWQVELDPYCRAVLAKHWPEAERFEDVRSVGASTLVPVDLICGGFPCQNLSSAGKRAGLAGASSGLWYEYLRIVSELQPSWVVVENVASGAVKWVDAVRTGLGELGYASLPVPIAAADLGAPHERQRVFIVAANANSVHVREEPGRSGGKARSGALLPVVDGIQRHVAANDNVSARREAIGHSGWSSTIPDFRRVDDGLRGKLDGPARRLKALGNSVVPQCSEVIGHVIQELMR